MNKKWPKIKTEMTSECRVNELFYKIYVKREITYLLLFLINRVVINCDQLIITEYLSYIVGDA